MSLSQPWFVLMSKPRHEERLARSLAAAGLEVFLPRLRCRDRRRGGWRSRPFFPRYLFARPGGEGSAGAWARLQWTEGLSQVVGFDGRPALLDGAVIAHWQRRLQGVDGDAFLLPKQGERVRVVEGPFRDYEAVFDRQLNGDGRVAVLLDILGRRTAVHLELREISRVA